MWERAGPPLLRVSGTEGGLGAPPNPEPEGPGRRPRYRRGVSWGAQRGRRGGGQAPPLPEFRSSPLSEAVRVKAPGGSRGISGSPCACTERPPTRLHSVLAVHLRHADVPGGEGETLKPHRVLFPRLPYK